MKIRIAQYYGGKIVGGWRASATGFIRRRLQFARTPFVLWILSCGWIYENSQIWIFTPPFDFAGVTPLPWHAVFVIFPRKEKKRRRRKKISENRLLTTDAVLSYLLDDKHCVRVVFRNSERAYEFTAHDSEISHDPVDEVRWRFGYTYIYIYTHIYEYKEKGSDET